MAQIFETHAHYDADWFDEDRDELLQSMPEAGIGYIVNVSSNLDSLDRTVELTQKYDFIYGSAGIHPTDSVDLTEDNFYRIEETANKPKIVAIGEIGLDYYWKKPDNETQKKWFIRQLELARKMDMPVIIHSRDASQDTLDIMREYQDLDGVIHCFSGSLETAREYVKMGFFIGVGGVVTFKNGRKMKEVVEGIPMESIVLETDCPYLAPVPHRGKRNSSTYIPLIAEEIAKIKNMTAEEVIQITYNNAKRLYRMEM